MRELAVLVPELLLIGQMIDRSGMAWCIRTFGHDEMVQIAIEEWAGASPVYTRRMQRALNFEGDDVPTIFKGLQLDIGAPPQFMDFRYTIHDRWHGEFHLDHCGALLDVEPMGDNYVFGMCHTIEDPTFDATAVATNPHAQVRPIHRPPRTPADRHPHCAWTVTSMSPTQRSRASLRWTLFVKHKLRHGNSIPSTGPTRGRRITRVPCCPISTSARSRTRRWSGWPTRSACRCSCSTCRSRSRSAERAADDAELAVSLSTRQLTGVAGLGAERIQRALGLPGGIDGVLRVFELHPLLNPAGYVVAETESGRVIVHRSPAHDDGAWISLCSPESVQPLQAIATAVDPHIEVRVSGTDTDWTAELVESDTVAAEVPEVKVAKFSRGSTFEFEPRRSLPLTVV